MPRFFAGLHACVTALTNIFIPVHLAKTKRLSLRMPCVKSQSMTYNILAPRRAEQKATVTGIATFGKKDQKKQKWRA